MDLSHGKSKVIARIKEFTAAGYRHLLALERGMHNLLYVRLRIPTFLNIYPFEYAYNDA